MPEPTGPTMDEPPPIEEGTREWDLLQKILEEDPDDEHVILEVPNIFRPYLPKYNSSHSNISESDYILLYRGPQQLSMNIVLPVTIFYVIIFITGVLGNSLVCVVILRKKSMQSCTNLYLFSLAVSDLFLLIIGLPNDLNGMWRQYPWIYGQPGCKLRALVSEMCSYSSVLVILAFSAERFMAICYPFVSHKMSTLERAYKIILMSWLVSFLASLPVCYYTMVHYLYFPHPQGRRLDKTAICSLDKYTLPEYFHLYEWSTALFFVVPLVIIIVMYSCIIVCLLKKDGYTFSGEGSIHSRGRTPEASKKTILRMLGVVVVAFFICWAPFHIQRLFYVHGNLNDPAVQLANEWLYYIGGFSYYFSSTVNPILYSLMSAKFRRAFKETLLCWGDQRGRGSFGTDSLRDETRRLREGRSAAGAMRNGRLSLRRVVLVEGPIQNEEEQRASPPSSPPKTPPQQDQQQDENEQEEQQQETLVQSDQNGDTKVILIKKSESLLTEKLKIDTQQETYI